MISFTKTIEVPLSIINRIENEVVRNVKKSLIMRNIPLDKITIESIIESIHLGFSTVSEPELEASYFNWELPDSVIFEIADCLRLGKGMSAIEAFQQATYTGLKTAMEAVGNFEFNDEGAKKFIVKFTKNKRENVNKHTNFKNTH